MSKRNKTPKTPAYRQGDLFAEQSEATDKEADGKSRAVRRAELLSRLEAQRTLIAAKRLKIRENCRGTLKRMPGGVGGQRPSPLPIPIRKQHEADILSSVGAVYYKDLCAPLRLKNVFLSQSYTM